MLSDTTNARIMQNDTTYNNIDKRGKLKLNSQQYFSKQSSQKLKDLKADIIDSPLIPIHSAE